MAARAAVAEGPDPDRLPEHDLLRQRRVRDRAGGRGVLRRARVGAVALAGGAARRHHRPTRRSTTRSRTRGSRASVAHACSRTCSTSRDITHDQYRLALAAAASPRPGRPPPRHARGRLRTSRTTSSSSSSTSTARAACSAAACRCARRSTSTCRTSRDRRSRSGCRRRAGRRRRSSPSTRATGACWPCTAGGASRRASSTSPSRASGSPARRSSRSRSPRRCNRGSRRRRRFDSKPVTISLDIGQGLVRPQLRGREPGYDRPRVGDDPLGQHGLRPAREDRRPAEDRRYGRTRSGSRAISTRSSRSCSAARPSTRSRWPARSRPSRTAGKRIDGSIFRNHPRAILSVNNRGNDPVPRQAISANSAAIVTRFLQEVVQEGTGVRAQLADGRPVAGKTGTTENYGDAWFVGYTPQLAVSVWVGYPNRLRPMTTEFQGQPVAGGTYPAVIFKTFMEQALAYLNAPAGVVPVAELPDARVGERRAPGRRLAARQRPVQGDDLAHVLHRPGARARSRTAVRARSRCRACSAWPSTTRPPRSRASRCGRRRSTSPRSRGSGSGSSSGRSRGSVRTSAAFDTVRLVLAKPLHGTVPSVIGLSSQAALERLAGAWSQARRRRADRGRRRDGARGLADACEPASRPRRAWASRSSSPGS